MTSVHGTAVFGGTFPAEIWHSLYSGGEIPCEDFSQPKTPITWAPFIGEFTSSRPAGDDLSKAARGREGTLPGQEAVGGYDPNAYAPGAGQEPYAPPAPQPRPPPPRRTAPRPGSAAPHRPPAAAGRLAEPRQRGGLRPDLGRLLRLPGRGGARPGTGRTCGLGRDRPPRRRLRPDAAASLTTSTATSTTPVSGPSTGSTHTSIPPLPRPGTPPSATSTGPGRRAVYGPLFTLGSYPLAWLPVGTAVLTLKVLAAVTTLALAALVARLAPARGLDPLRAAAFVGLNPLVLVHVVGGPHNDGAAMLLAMLGVAATLAGGGARRRGRLRGRRRDQGVGPLRRTLRAARRPAPAALPARRVARRWRLLALVAWPAFGLHWLSALGVAGKNLDRTSQMSVPVELHLAGRTRQRHWRAGRALYIWSVRRLPAALDLARWRWVRGRPGRASDSSSPQAGCCRGTWFGRSPWRRSPATAPLQLLVLAITAFQLGTRIPL